jgi:predicted amidohydrolase
MRVAAVQHDIVWERPQANFARLAPRIAAAAGAGARLVALTEMFSNGFSMATDRIAEPFDGPSTEFLVTQAGQTGAWVCGSVPSLADGEALPHNRLVLAGPDGTVHRYAKRHRFAFAGEDDHFAAGDATLTVDIEGVRVTLFVCFDLRFGPDFWHLAGDTDLYVVVANWPATRRQHWLTLLQARAIENQAYVLGVNRMGTGDGLSYSGDSRLFDPLGVAVATAEADVECIISGEVDPATVADIRARYPFR